MFYFQAKPCVVIVCFGTTHILVLHSLPVFPEYTGQHSSERVPPVDVRVMKECLIIWLEMPRQWKADLLKLLTLHVNKPIVGSSTSICIESGKSQ